MGTPLTISIASEQPLDPQAYRDLLAIFQVELKDQISIAPATFQIPAAWKEELIPELEPTGATVQPVQAMGIDLETVLLVLSITKTSIDIAEKLAPHLKKWYEEYQKPKVYLESEYMVAKKNMDDDFSEWMKNLFK